MDWMAWTRHTTASVHMIAAGAVMLYFVQKYTAMGFALGRA
ncbi:MULTISPECIES: hypothetical protein [Roseovarius]|nr:MULTISPECIES: hypothetical protein [unclassified Roseovarius]